jgi:hypothetical protein
MAYKHYVEIDSDCRIIEYFSDAFKQPSENSICVNENGARQFILSLYNEYGLCKRWVKNKIIDAAPKVDMLIKIKLDELKDYYKNSSDVRKATVNNKYFCCLTSNCRSLIAEQYTHLINQIDKGEITKEEAFFKYDTKDLNSISCSVNISLAQLQDLHVKIMQIVNFNYAVKEAHIKSLTLLTTKQAVDNYDYKKDFLINQAIQIVE